jgi:hypothetical protein
MQNVTPALIAAQDIVALLSYFCSPLRTAGCVYYFISNWFDFGVIILN